jgi:hypothetical protein
MKRIAEIVAVAVVPLMLSAAGNLYATGYFGPSVYLDNGGKNVDASPEFYWGLEVRRLAQEFHPPEKLVETPAPQSEGSETAPAQNTQAMKEASLKDFAAALKDGEIKPNDPAQATQQHADVRTFLDQSATDKQMPGEFECEFADYDRAAFAFHQGKEHWDEAKTAWENLLKRPENERRYRTIWAAFMLGKLALKTGDYPAAATWFQRTRQLAAAGFVDSLGLAADSYGWEGRCEWKQDHPEKAAVLFLTQLALGDPSAVVSLKALIPDRDPIDGMLNYGPELDERSKWTDEQKKAEEDQEMAKLKTAAQSPLLRRLVTAHILATASSPDLYSDESGASAVNRCARWLAMVKQANLGRVEDAEYLGWVAYNNGDYKSAAHWLELSKGDTPAALWLKAKLERRAGKLADAATSMAQAWKLIQTTPYYYKPVGEASESDDYDTSPEGGHWAFAQSASGDLGGLRLARADFVQSLDTLLKGRLWEDAAFVAERVLRTNELKKYVDSQPTAPPPAEGEDYNAKLKYLLGRRLVREHRYADAEHYLPAPYDKILEKYTAALKDGANKRLSAADRARAWFTAAWLARYDGMELMGTEVAPDGFAESGELEMPDIAKQRRTGFYEQVSYGKDGEEKKNRHRIMLKASKQEVRRLTASKPTPDLRFHYRMIAGELAIKAAQLLPNNSDELADVVNTAGLWVKDRDEKVGDRYYNIVEKRCPNTEIGRAVIAKHWFVDQQGPWSTAQQKAYDALHQDLSPGKSQ